MNLGCNQSRTTFESSGSTRFRFRWASNATKPIPLPLSVCDVTPAMGYPCLVHAKSDADINCIREIMNLPNVTLMTNTRVTRLLTNTTGTAVTAVEVIHSGSGKPNRDALTPTRSDLLPLPKQAKRLPTLLASLQSVQEQSTLR